MRVTELGAMLGGRYRLDQVLGQGGMATIFRATDSKLGREVAVKLLRPAYGADAQFVERFEREAQSAASLSHPNVVAVYDFGNDPAGPYIVMEQVAGGDLSVVLNERGPLPPTAVARTGQQVADALAAAHARGLVHRDIKPSNILLSPDGRVQVADFGIAQAAAVSPITATGITLGSVLYFSPEQARGDTATSASDIYSLGLVMYEMLTGKRAFSGDSPAAVAVARLSGGVPSPMAARPDVPPSLDALVRSCLAVDPAARPSASQLSSALARFISDPAGAATYATTAGVSGTAGMAVAWAGVPGVPPPPTQTVLTATGRPATPAGERGASGPWAWMAAGLGLLVIVASGILLFLLFSGIGEAETATPSPTPSAVVEIIATPDFVGKREANAVRLAERSDLTLELDYVESEDQEPGRVIDQLPQAGVEIPHGSTVHLSVATRVETVLVPEVQGIIEETALEQLETVGLEVGVRFMAEDALPAGYVIATDPRAGMSVTRGSTIDYVVSRGMAADGTPGPARTARPVPTITATPDGGQGGPQDPSAVATASPPTPTLRPSAATWHLPASPVPTWHSWPPPTAEPASPRPGSTPLGSPDPGSPPPAPSPTAGTSPGAATASPGAVSASPGAASSPESSTPRPAVSPTPGRSTRPSPPTTDLPTLPPMASLEPIQTHVPGSEASAGSSARPLLTPFPSDQTTLVGDFLCLDFATARTHLEKAGLLVGATIPLDPPPEDSWLVHDQLPKPGERVPVGTAVALELMDPLQPCPRG